MSTRDAFMHEAPIEVMGEGKIQAVILEARRSPVMTAVLNLLRNQAALLERAGRQTPKASFAPDGRQLSAEVDPLEYRAFHSGAVDGLEEAFWTLMRMMQGAEQDTGGGG